MPSPSLRICLLPGLLVGAVAVLLAPLSTAQQLLAYDGFGNGPRADLAGSVGGSGWTSAWVDVGTDPTTVAGTGLTYPGLSTTFGAAVTPTATGVWPSSIHQRAFPTQPTSQPAIYVSFLMRDDAAYGSWGGLSFGQYPYKMTVGSPSGMYTYGLMVSQGLGSLSNRPLVQGQTVLVVVKIARNPAGTGIAYHLYLDPAIGSPEPSYSVASFGLAAVQNLPNYLSIDNGTGFTTDEIRVGTTWDAVLPAQVVTWTDLGFAKPGVHGAPHLVGAGPLSAYTLNGVSLTNANATAPALLVLGAFVINQPFLGGTLVPDASIVLPMTTDTAGSAGLQVLWPAGIPAGLPLRFQFWIADPAATFGYAASNGLQGVTQ